MTDAPIFIIGYMACGKTTFGRALAKSLGRQFIDLDFFIEQRFRMSISEIFRTRGEEAFRKIESNILREVGSMLNVVISCGGGTPCFFDNMDFMLGAGLTVFLRTSPEIILKRLLINRSRRPLLAATPPEELRAKIEADLAAREPVYARAHITHRGEELENRRQIDATVARFLPLLP